MTRINVDYYMPALQGQTDLRLHFFGMEECLPSHSWGPGLRDAYILHYVHSGTGTFTTGGTTYRLGAGQGFLIVPDMLVQYTADESDPWTYTWIGFQGVLAKTILQRAHLNASHPVYEAGLDGGFPRFYGQLRTAMEGPGGDVLSQGILYGLLGELIRDCRSSGETPRPTTSKEAYVRKAVGYIESSYSQRISIQDIARSVGLDRTYLSGLFKDQFGVSLQAFLLEYRMKRAAVLLHNLELSVSDVSRSVGYTDPFLFSKMFKKTIGSSPRAYREQQISSAN
ncbi:AraC family transcriptional regulator [Paenibacillus sp. XY044]|uniref:AraC family transcriptional regulator n=1 Tax=Paenibacillus sp. XY044 TaxID=2026089 RepID=UPI000B990C82|nr:AraC family transcriptional regulator [Paenibacillus sp. XY044]OZB92813.1 AraC family transcriptional regulator [Paenibacillus sp. XY044]